MAEPLTDAGLESIRKLLAQPGRRVLGAGPARALLARLDDAEGEGCTLHGDAPHGQEAEELRKGVEEALRYGTLAEIRDHLSELLDRVQARDSLAHLRAKEELAAARARAKTLADATRVWRMNCECACSACQILDDALPGREGAVMAERAPKLEWKDRGAGTWQAFAGEVLLTVSEYSDDLRAFWRISVGGRDGTRGSLLAAQLAAEDAAFAWLAEGVAALGGKVLPLKNWERAVAFADALLDVLPESLAKGWAQGIRDMLAREMGGGT